jgi:dihydroflavonol-4-reductase
VKAIVTGSNGFIGSTLVNTLLQQRIQVCCLVRTESTPPHHRTCPISYHCIDYRSPNTVYCGDAFENVDYVFHVAGVTKGITKEDFHNGNVQPTISLLHALKEHGIKPKRFVLISSLSASGPAPDADHPRCPSDTPHPIEYYGKSKLAAEQAALSFSDTIPITIIRPPAVYGPRDKDFLQLFSLIQKGFNVFHGNKNHKLSIIYAQDLVDSIIAAAKSEHTIGKIYHPAHDDIVTWEEIQNMIVSVIGNSPKTFSIPPLLLDIAGYVGSGLSMITRKPSLLSIQKVKLSKPCYWTADPSDAKRDFGLSAPTSLQDGITKTYQWYKENGWL